MAIPARGDWRAGSAALAAVVTPAPSTVRLTPCLIVVILELAVLRHLEWVFCVGLAHVNVR